MGVLLEPLADAGGFLRGQPAENRAFFAVPGLWGGFQLKPSPYAGDGFATYRLRIRMDPVPRNPALRVGLIQTAYHIWVNGELVGSGGIVGKGPQTAEPQAEVNIFRLAGTADTLDLIVQVANYFQSRGAYAATSPWAQKTGSSSSTNA